MTVEELTNLLNNLDPHGTISFEHGTISFENDGYTEYDFTDRVEATFEDGVWHYKLQGNY